MIIKRNNNPLMRKITNPFAGMEGFHCFGCCKDNDHGVHMDFYEDGDDVVCFWKPDSEYQGWRNTLHGGIQATLLDETAAWVVFRKLQVMGVTSKLELSYRRPVLTTDSQITLRGHITEQKRNLAFVDLTLENSKGGMHHGTRRILSIYPGEVSRKWLHRLWHRRRRTPVLTSWQ